MSNLAGRWVKFVKDCPWTTEYSKGDHAEITTSRCSQDEAPAVVVQGVFKCSQIVSCSSIRYLNNKEVVNDV